MRHSAPRSRPALLSGFSLVVLVFLLVLSPASLSAEERKQPNLIWIMADDLGCAELGCYGQKTIRTPRNDRMAAEGLRFTHYYAGATVCAPSRSVLITGQHHGRTRVRGNAGRTNPAAQALQPGDPSVAAVLHKAGYLAARMGKLYHYNVPGSVGTDGDDDPASWEMEFNPAGVDLLIEEPDIFTLVPGHFGRVLYDHDADPKERNNLAEDSAHADTVARLSAQLREAVRASYPPDGKLREKQENPWPPELR